ncbi:hypothetical protein [Tissierella praeacuta]|uniref:hypothetical protein n=1 Tax=Tissierella praeacuta TaxID=43131 RepID=UPI001C10526F|nr:hypothetical protein [Tissierella praeacuta]MBU5257597.1 hypothetical protein [Tissierella praeacuta]
MNKYIRYMKKYILLVVVYHIIIWFFFERQGFRRHEVGFFDNFLFNSFIITITIMGSWIPNIISRFINFLKSRKE